MMAAMFGTSSHNQKTGCKSSPNLGRKSQNTKPIKGDRSLISPFADQTSPHALNTQCTPNNCLASWSPDNKTGNILDTGQPEKQTENGDICLVQLASMEEFSDLGASSIAEDSLSCEPISSPDLCHSGSAQLSSNSDVLLTLSNYEPAVVHSDFVPFHIHQNTNSNADSMLPLSDSLATQRKAKSEDISRSSRPKNDRVLVDMNYNKNEQPPGIEQWLEQCIASTADLERIFVQNGYSNTNELSEDATQSDNELQYTLLDFAERYFNIHYISGGPSSALSKTVKFFKRKSNQEIVPLETLLRYTKNHNLQTSHVRLLNPRNTQLACSIFKDVCKYLRGDLKPEFAFILLLGILKQGIDHVELRDEIYCQAIRQCTQNHHEDSTIRAWHILCLCSEAFQPCKTFRKYVKAFMRHHIASNDHISRYAQYCMSNLQRKCTEARVMPPSFPEVEAVINMRDMEFPIHLLDGRVINVHIQPRAQVTEVIAQISAQLDLSTPTGWALYESTPDYDRHIRDTRYLADIISKWEQKERKLLEASLGATGTSSPKKTAPTKLQSPKLSSPQKSSLLMLSPLNEFGKLIFLKQIFERIQDSQPNAQDVHLLYSQAVHYTVRLDEYNVNTSMALHLAGLQAQVMHGPYEPDLETRYAFPEDYLCERILTTQHQNLSEHIAAAHKRYGGNLTPDEARLKYLTMVSQYPLYGCTKVFVHYRGIWPYGAETVLAVDHEGIKIVSIQEKHITFSFYYSEIEKIHLEEQRNEFYITIQLRSCVTACQQKCFLFECIDLEDFAQCVEFHSPAHAFWLTAENQSWRHRKFQAPEDWLHLSDSLVVCRLSLIRKGIVRFPAKSGSGLLRSALSRLSRQSCKASTQNIRRPVSDSAIHVGEIRDTSSGEEDNLLDESQAFSSYWFFNKNPFKTSLLEFSSHELEDIAARMFNSTLVYTGLESADILQATDLVIVVQALIIKCMEKDELCNELYLQLIKQTTETQDINDKVTLRYWHLMTMATCVMFPPNATICHYLTLHLKRSAMETTTEAGKYALFCIKNLYRIQEKGKRKFPPSFKEIEFVIKRQAIEARVSVADGHQMLTEFDSASTAEEVLQLIKAKAGMRLDAGGFAIYLVLGTSENYICSEEHLADSLHMWESYAKTSGCKEVNIICKKRLFLDPPVNYKDPVEVELVYYQSVTDLFEQKIPLTKRDAVHLCALRAQTEFGDYGHASTYDYSSVVRILPRHLRTLIGTDEIPPVHKTLVGLVATQAHITFMDILRHWPLYGATMFKVTQNCWSSLPHRLWLAVSQSGVYLIEYRGQKVFYKYSFDEIRGSSPSNKGLTFVIGQNDGSPSMLFVTKDAEQISKLIADYHTIEKERSVQTNEVQNVSENMKPRQRVLDLLTKPKASSACNSKRNSPFMRRRTSSFGGNSTAILQSGAFLGNKTEGQVVKLAPYL